jgi:nitroreductase
MTDDIAALSRLLDERFTCRSFLPDQVPSETLTALLGLAQRTPSWCNTQPWHVEITSGAATVALREGLSSHVMSQPQAPDFDWPAGYPGVYGERRRECGFQLYDAVGIERSDKDARLVQMLRNFEFFDAPHVALITTEADLGPYGAVDCGLWVQSFLLGAQALGLAAAPQAALASYAPFFRSHFGLPENRQVVCGISFGYADPKAPINAFRTSRVGLGDAVTFHG